MDLDLEAIQVIQEGPHQVCIQTGANDRMDPDQTRVHRAISVGVAIQVVIQAVIPVVSQVAGIIMVVSVVIPVAILVMEEVIPVVVMQVIIQEAEAVAIPVIQVMEEVAI